MAEETETINVTIQPVKVTEDEKIEFYKSFLSNKAYTGTEYLFDKQFNITFKSLTVKETMAVFDQLRKDQLSNYINTDSNYMMALTNYRLGIAIVTMNDEDFQPDITKEDYKPANGDDSYIKARAEIFNDWPAFKLGALAEAFRTFEDKVVYLTKEIHTPDFWKAGQ
ncbi:hypothetical protein [Acinetobacter sp.]|uniref:hypothetical protein n=1 Tax=Acinetobacter sp. TaxID=472 RepID=UPI003752791E